jgi:hypothetical protein
VARPDLDFIGWYVPTIGERGREPDFIVFGNQQGLLVLKVKDWLIDQIEEAVHSNFYDPDERIMIDFAMDPK